MDWVRWGDSSGAKKYFSQNPSVLGVLFWMGVLAGVCFMLPAAGDPIPIDSIETLQKIGNDAAYPLEGDYILTQDIDASDTVNWNGGKGFDPICDDVYNENDHFMGSFDGQGHIIFGLVINRPLEDFVGVFSYSEGQIKNVGLCDSSISGHDGTGGLAGISYGGVVTQCFSTGTVSGNRIVGGLVGGNGNTVAQCFSACTVFGNGETEDGYAPGVGDEGCEAHDSDYNPQDWYISLSELLRVFQFYNVGGYRACAGEGTEDGFCPN